MTTFTREELLSILPRERHAELGPAPAKPKPAALKGTLRGRRCPAGCVAMFCPDENDYPENCDVCERKLEVEA